MAASSEATPATVGLVNVVNSEQTCEIEATVATGFETLAQEEVLEKYMVKSTMKRGSINFSLPVDKVETVTQLCSVDNISVILNHYHNFRFADNAVECLKQFEDLVPQINWELGLKVWEKFFKFPHPISYEPNPCKPQVEGNIEAPKQEKDKESEFSNTEPPAKKPKNPLLPSFRSTCYRSGKHVFQSPQVAAEFGGAIQNYFGWNVDLKNHDIEVVINVDGDHVYICIDLTRQSLHKRHLVQFGPTSLRPTLAYGMLRFCKIQPGDVICDPMCGGGSIPIEAAVNWTDTYNICGDLYETCPPRTVENTNAVNDRRRQDGRKNLNVDTLWWDSTQLPLRNSSVDVFIADLPFGKRSGNKMRNWQLYPMTLKEMARVCRPGTGRACLLTQDRKCIIRSFESVKSLWKRGPTLGINIGGLSAGVFLLYRTIQPHPDEKKTEAMSDRKDCQTKECNISDR